MRVNMRGTKYMGMQLHSVRLVFVDHNPKGQGHCIYILLENIVNVMVLKYICKSHMLDTSENVNHDKMQCPVKVKVTFKVTFKIMCFDCNSSLIILPRHLLDPGSLWATLCHCA